MIVCPECRTALQEDPRPRCRACGWEADEVDGVVDFMPRQLRRQGLEADYERNYERIARDDLHQSIQDPDYIAHLTEDFAERVGELDGAKVCDLGVGQGALARTFLRQGVRELTAVDIAMEYLVQLKDVPAIRLVRANAESLPFVDEFDVVVSTDVLEHVINVGSLMYCVNRALRLGGQLFVRVPYKEDLLMYSRHLGCPYEFVHLRTFDRALLRHALECAGFSVQRTWFGGYWNYVRQPIWTRGGLCRWMGGWFERWLFGNYGIENGQRFVPVPARGWQRSLVWFFLKPNELTIRAVKVRDLSDNLT